MISFKGAHYPRGVILFAVFFYVRYPVSYRDLEEIMAERGVVVDHATLNRWVVKYAPLIADEARKRKVSGAKSWRADETYIKVKGRWVYLYRAIDKHGQTLDFMLSESRDHAAATDFFWKTLVSLFPYFLDADVLAGIWTSFVPLITGYPQVVGTVQNHGVQSEL